MSRARNQSIEDVRQKALEAFWTYGYHETSLSVLEDFTKTGRRSLLNSFGDKQSLFEETLADFSAQAAALYLSPMEAPNAGLSGIEESLNRLVATATTPMGRKGCLICNTARSPIAEEAKVKAHIDAYFERIEKAFQTALHVASHQGEIAQDTDIERLSRFFLGIVVSLCVMARAGADEDTINSIAFEALEKLR